MPPTIPSAPTLKDINLSVHSGEIVGIAGVSGNGQQELLYAMSGEGPLEESTRCRSAGSRPGAWTPAAAARSASRFVPEERLGRGAVPSMSLAENAILTAPASGIRAARTHRLRGGRAPSPPTASRYNVKCGGPPAQAQSLSGGNLQKFIVGREVLQQPKVLVVAQPTWGVDVGAAAFIRQSISICAMAGAPCS